MYIETKMPLNSAKDVIDALYRHHGSLTRTSFANPTYLDKECTEVECAANRRSFEDLLTLAKSYFPETTELDLMQILLDLKLSFIFCEDIRKIVFSHPEDNYVNYKNRLDYIEEEWRDDFVDGTYTAKYLKGLYEQL